MSDSKRIRHVDGPGRVKGPQPADSAVAVDAVRGPDIIAGVDPANAVGPAAAIMADITARLGAGSLDRAAATRAWVAAVIEHELDALDPQSRARVVEEVVELLAEEPAWQARFDGLWGGGSR